MGLRSLVSVQSLSICCTPPETADIGPNPKTRCGRIWAAQPTPWAEVFVNVVRPPEGDIKVATEGHSLSAPPMVFPLGAL